MDRARVGREPMPSAAVIDSQSVKTTEAGGPCGYDAGKKVKGRKRHAMVDTDGRTLELLVHPADVHRWFAAGVAVQTILAELGSIPVIFVIGTPEACEPCDAPAVLSKPIDEREVVRHFRMLAPI